MCIELTKEEIKLTRMLLEEEIEQINELINNSNGNDKEELISQANMMKAIIAKL